jgi:alpha-galactosidase
VPRISRLLELLIVVKNHYCLRLPIRYSSNSVQLIFRSNSHMHRSGAHLLCFSSCLALLSVTAAMAQRAPAAISIDESAHVFRIDAGDSTYEFGVNERKRLQTLYWGERISAKDHPVAAKESEGSASFDAPVNTTPQEFVGWGGGLYVEPDLKITFPDGNRDLDLRYTGHTLRDGVLSVQMKDISLPVTVTLEYKADEETGIVGRRALVTNNTGKPFVIESASAGTWNLPRGTDYVLRYLSGRWAGEWTVNDRKVQPGKTILESRRGTTGSQNNPWFSIRTQDTTEEHGDVWFGGLAWSGSWQIAVESDAVQQVRVTGGFNPFDFGYQLKAGATLETPWFYAGHTSHGLGDASRKMHRLELHALLPHAPKPKLRPVLYNSWEATEFKVDEAGQMALAEKAATLGVERFVMDDGWFGARNDDHAGLGDWTVNPQKFPQGLKPLIDKVHALKMDFGLWVEPEMVNPNSDLYRKHPDWVLHFEGRPQTEGRNQLVLNLAREDVRQYVLGFLDKLLNENDIAFLKWDYNRNWSEPGWPAVGPDAQKNVYVDFTRNFYSVLSELKSKHPNVEIESCSGGGGRVDLGVIGLTDEVWTSDNTDAFDRLRIQHGFTQAYMPGIMMAWVTDSPTWVNQRTLSLEYRFLSSMQGSLGIGANLAKFTPDEMATSRRMIDAYKSIRETVQRGDLYRLVEPIGGSEVSATESVAADKHQAVLFAFLHSSTELYPFPRLKLQGLDSEKVYTLRSIHGKASNGTPASATGSYWMNKGIDVMLRGDFQAAAFVLEAASR